MCDEKKKILILGAVIIVLVFGTFLFIKMDAGIRFVDESEMDNFVEEQKNEKSNTALGNSIGNGSGGGGKEANDAEWIYYTSSKDNKMYKMKLDGTVRKKICDDSALNINVLSDWLYYINRNDEHKLYKIETNGENRTILVDTFVTGAKVMGDWVYYIDNGYDNEPFEPKGELWRIKSDGTEKELISSKSECVEEFVLFDGMIIMSVSNNVDRESDWAIYRTTATGENKEKIADTKGSFINVAEEWIYYCDSKDSDALYKIRMDGTEKQKILDSVVNSVNVSGGWIYYTLRDEDWKLYRMEINGTQNEKLSNDKCFFVCIVGERIIYTHFPSAERDSLYKVSDGYEVTMKLDGSDSKRLY